MSKGLDCATVCGQPDLTCFKVNYFQGGEETGFIGRYYAFNFKKRDANGDPTPLAKCLTVAEAKLISNNKFTIVAVYELRAGAKKKKDKKYHVDDFEYDKGTRDAEAAYTYALNVIGQPKDSAIYFAVDYPAPAYKTDLKALVGYFTAVRRFFLATNDFYKVGVYGSGTVCSTMATTNITVGKVTVPLAGFTWLADAAKWPGSAAYKTWNIKQGLQPPNWPCIPVDTDQGAAVIGDFVV